MGNSVVPLPPEGHLKPQQIAGLMIRDYEATPLSLAGPKSLDSHENQGISEPYSPIW